MEHLQEILKNLPDSPGVYFMKDKTGRIIYVGKAKILKNRVRQYFQNTDEKDPKTRALVSRIHHIETIVTQTEAEALILENTLIKLHKPKFNILLKDDKTYPYIRITVPEDFPKIEITRTIRKDGAKYFGAYTKPSDVRKSIEVMRKIFPIRTCNRQINEKTPQRPCLFYHIGLCSAPCAGKISVQDYNDIVREACRFLEGKQEEILYELEEKMQEHAQNMEFEKAAIIRDKLKSIANVTAKQLVLSTKMEDRDLCAFIRDKINSMIVVLFVRGGKLMGKNINLLENTYDLDDGEILEAFITQFYGNGREIPPEILLTHTLDNENILVQWLHGVRGKAVKLYQPVRGDKRSQIDLAMKNAEEEFGKYRIAFLGARENMQKALKKLEEVLALPEPPNRIEAYDISNTGSDGIVAGMVVFLEGLAEKSHYRKFTIRSTGGQNDYAAMQEALFRRLKRFSDASADESFSEKPDLILVDGGIGHVHAALEVLKELGLQLPVVGMAKDDRHQTSMLVNDKITLELKLEPSLMPLVAAVQEEVHRFAIGFHRSKRLKEQRKSALDGIEGIGPKKKKALLKHFGSVKKIREATDEQLCSVEGINAQLAKKIKDTLSN
ncbi:MAG: excinuclease ABC subunit UvrC [Thermoclostridium sp.]|nr:excinuclease ABC subunit UvrC [Thermoclostridium sp.]